MLSQVTDCQTAFPLQDTHSSLTGVANDQPPWLHSMCKHGFCFTGLLCAALLLDWVTGLPLSCLDSPPTVNFSAQGVLSISGGIFC